MYPDFLNEEKAKVLRDRAGRRVNSMRANASDFIAVTVSDFVSPV